MRVCWTDPAAANWEQAFDYIAQEDPGAALRIAERILDLTEMLAEHPYAGRAGRIAGTRALVVSETPFIVVYGVEASEGVVWIYAVYHGRRRWPKEFPKQ